MILESACGDQSRCVGVLQGGACWLDYPRSGRFPAYAKAASKRAMVTLGTRTTAHPGLRGIKGQEQSGLIVCFRELGGPAEDGGARYGRCSSTTVNRCTPASCSADWRQPAPALARSVGHRGAGLRGRCRRWPVRWHGPVGSARSLRHALRGEIAGPAHSSRRRRLGCDRAVWRQGGYSPAADRRYHHASAALARRAMPRAAVIRPRAPDRWATSRSPWPAPDRRARPGRRPSVARRGRCPVSAGQRPGEQSRNNRGQTTILM